ncbi:DMT family transporter [Bacillus sp. FJAT-52991]|uniref:DMT family transporter n=1 Tax=Bacillus kandeliae TaxID=3129297 RepID=A0ABZ2N8Q4_9BACI
MNQLRYSLFVLLGACSYGLHSSLVKLTTNAGYQAEQATGAQYFFGLLLLLVVVLFTKRVKLNMKQIGSLLGLGILLSLTGVFYATSIEQLSASMAIVLLFQFTWIGIVIESIYLRTFPSNLKLISIVFLWGGTLLAGGLVSGHMDWMSETKGLVFGFLAAVTFALFIFFSGKAGKGVPTIQRSLIITAGGFLTVLLFVPPTFIVDGTLTGGLWKYGLLVGLFGVVLPVILFAIGTPHIDSGTATIVGAAELPAAILSAMLILGEQITPEQATGVLLILIGIVVPQWRSKKATHPKKVYMN